MTPQCFGVLHDKSSEVCQACLLLDKCGRVSQAANTTEIPTDRRSLVLAVLRKFGIPAVYTDRTGKTYHVNEENVDSFGDPSCILTTKESLRRLLTFGG